MVTWLNVKWTLKNKQLYFIVLKTNKTPTAHTHTRAHTHVQYINNICCLYRCLIRHERSSLLNYHVLPGHRMACPDTIWILLMTLKGAFQYILGYTSLTISPIVSFLARVNIASTNSLTSTSLYGSLMHYPFIIRYVLNRLYLSDRSCIHVCLHFG